MIDYSGWLLRLRERIPMVWASLLFIYTTKMSIAWAIAFFLFAIISWNTTTNPFMASIIQAFCIVGGIFTILMIKSMAGEVKEVGQLRQLYSNYLNSLSAPGNTWDPSTKEAFLNFQNLFKRICPEVSSINLPGSELPEPTQTMIEARKKDLDQSKIGRQLNPETMEITDYRKKNGNI